MCSLQPCRVVLHCVSIAPPGLNTKGMNLEAVLAAYLLLLACAARPRTCWQVSFPRSVDRNWLKTREMMVMSNS